MNKKDTLYSFWNNWMDMKEEIERSYQRKDPLAVVLMEKAIENYLLMIESFLPSKPSIARSSIEPLNGKERLQFIREKITAHFAYIQLDALYTEAMKKAVSRLATKK